MAFRHSPFTIKYACVSLFGGFYVHCRNILILNFIQWWPPPPQSPPLQHTQKPNKSTRRTNTNSANVNRMRERRSHSNTSPQYLYATFRILLLNSPFNSRYVEGKLIHVACLIARLTTLVFKLNDAGKVIHKSNESNNPDGHR